MTRVRTRFAPSPTGSLHVGNARIAVLNWLVARHHGGDFILRIEDTDRERNVEGAEAAVVADLRWLGLHWDEGPTEAGASPDGRSGPYRQSERLDLYARRAAALVEQGRAYRCFCTAETLDQQRRSAREGGGSRAYAGTCRSIAGTAAGERARSGEPHVIRLRVPDSGAVVVEDAIRGPVTFRAEELGDFVLMRSDGLPTYNFAVVVDDAAMGISHVIRGAGHLSNTPHQRLVYDALEEPPPVFAHVPTVLAPDRRKLSKRTGATPLAALRDEGVHPDGVINYLSLLGWSSPSGEEILPRDRLIEEVHLDRVGAADVVYDPEKLRWISARHIERMSLSELAEAARPFLAGTPCAALFGASYEDAIEAVRDRIATFSDLRHELPPFLGLPPGSTPPSDALDATSRGALGAVLDELRDVAAWDDASLGDALKRAGVAAGARGRALYVPVRRVLTGEEHGPSLAAILRIQGRDRVLERLELALSQSDGGV